jgi:NADPH:quinone reductase-like Zn-dependent oxidoreductase
MAFAWCIRRVTSKTVRLIMLKQNQDLQYLNERFEAGQLAPVIDGPYPLSKIVEALRHFGSGEHKGKVVITIE